MTNEPLLKINNQAGNSVYGGSNVGNKGGVEAAAIPWRQFSHSIAIDLSPLAVLSFAAP
jgi:hypothetical protein